MPRDPKRRQRGLPQTIPWLLLAILMISLGLRVYRLGDKSVWWDEGLAAWAARQSLAASSRWTAADVHPPLYFWMLHFWRLASGDSEFGLRLMSALIGVLTAASAYLLGKRVGGRETGLLAALLVSLSRFDIWWSQEMRMYALAALLGTLSLWTAIRFWDHGRLVDGAAYVLLSAAGLYTLYLQVSVLVVVNLVWLWVWVRAKDRWRAAVRWGGAQMMVLALFAPWLFYALGRIPTWSSASPVQPGAFMQIYWTVLTIGASTNVEQYAWLTLPLLALFVAGLAALLWRERQDWRVGRNAALLLLGLLLPASVVYLVSLPRETFFYSPQLAPRYLLIFAPAFNVLMAWIIARIGDRGAWRWLRAGAALLVIAAAVVGLAGYYASRVRTDDYVSLAATLHAYQQPGDAVVLYTDKDWPVFAYHHPAQWIKIPHALNVTPQEAEAYVAPVWASHEGVWLVVTPYAGVNDPLGHVPAWLAERAAAVVKHPFEDKELRLYARTPARAESVGQISTSAPQGLPLDLDLGTGMRLAAYEQAVPVYRLGETIHLFLRWAGGEGQVRVGLRDSHGHEVTATKAALPEMAAATEARQRIDLRIPPGAAPGRYTLSVQPASGGAATTFGRVQIRPWTTGGAEPLSVKIAHPLETDFGDGVRLLGYELPTLTVQPGGTVPLTLYWQAREPVEQRYKVFTHILGETYNAQRDSFLWGQQDNEPGSDTQPTTTWRPGAIVVDRYAIPLDADAPEGDYVIEIGLYRPATGDRLPVLDADGQEAGDHLIVAHIQASN